MFRVGLRARQLRPLSRASQFKRPLIFLLYRYMYVYMYKVTIVKTSTIKNSLVKSHFFKISIQTFQKYQIDVFSFQKFYLLNIQPINQSLSCYFYYSNVQNKKTKKSCHLSVNHSIKSPPCSFISQLYYTKIYPPYKL